MTKNLVRRASTALSPFVLLIASTTPAYAKETPAKAAPAAANPQGEAAKAWGFAASDIPVDPNIVFGVPPHGMKYPLLNNSTHKDSVVIRMRLNRKTAAKGKRAEVRDDLGARHTPTKKKR